MDVEITRRDFVNSVLVGSGAALLCGGLPAGSRADAAASFDPGHELTDAWTGFGGVGDYAASNGNTAAVVNAAHRVRYGTFDDRLDTATDTGEVYDMVIVGAGFAGLSAALEFKKTRDGSHTCLVLDNHPIFGGEAKRNEFEVNGQRLICPQGSNTWFVPKRDSELGRLWSELNLPFELAYREWEGEPRSLKFAKDNYGFQLYEQHLASCGFFYDRNSGADKPRWVVDPWSNGFRDAPIPQRVKDDLVAWENYRELPYQGKDYARWLDSMSYRDYIENIMGLGPEVTAYADPIMAAGFGLDCASHSAYVATHASLPGVRAFPGADVFTGGRAGWNSANVVSLECFPGGNGDIARHFVKALIPDAIGGNAEFGDVIGNAVNFPALDRPGQSIRMRLSSTAVAVRHVGLPGDAKFVDVTYLKDGKLNRVRARTVVMAGAGWINKRVVRDLPAEHLAAYNTFIYAPTLVINVALTNWRFMHKLGITACRYFEGLGFSCNIRKPMLAGDYQPPLNPDQPTVLTFYMSLYHKGLPAREQGIRGRSELFGTSYAEYERRIREQMSHLFGMAGFDARRDIAGIVLNRWGHAYGVAQPGFFHPHDGSVAPADIIRKQHGRISFGHAELQGLQLFDGAHLEGTRAAKQALALL